MTDNPELIRQQMEETRSQLSHKLESLEHQVVETVQSTGVAVTATAGAVQETIQTVTDAVQDAVQSVGKAFDLSRQMRTHPWLILGGSVAVGFLAGELLEEFRHSSRSSPGLTPGQRTSGGNGSLQLGKPVFASTASAGFRESNSPLRKLTNAATAAAIGVIQDAALRVVPEIENYLNRRREMSSATEADNAASDAWQNKMSTNSDHLASFSTARR